jgi:hypothetical protein
MVETHNLLTATIATPIACLCAYSLPDFICNSTGTLGTHGCSVVGLFCILAEGCDRTPLPYPLFTPTASATL